MFPIYIKDSKIKEGITINEFSQNFKKICAEHQNAGKASSFAFIIHDFKNPYVTKVLNDIDYFNALNEISGNDLTVFYLSITSSFKQNSLPSIATEMNKFLSQEFEIEDEVKTPAILFFQVKDKEVIDYFFCSLKEETIEKAFLEIEGLIKRISLIMSEISPNNRKNYQQIFNLIKSDIDSVSTIQIIKAKVGGVYKFGKIILFIEKIFSLF